MVASRIGEDLARMRGEEQRNIAAAEEHRARQLQERFDARRFSGPGPAGTGGPGGLVGQGNPEMIGRAHEAATAWKPYDPEAAQASERICEQVQLRHGIDVNKAGADEASVSEALARAQQARGQAEIERTRATAVRTDEAVAGAAVAGANHDHRTARAEHNEPARTQLNDARAWKAKETAKRSTRGSWRTNTKGHTRAKQSSRNRQR